jgi:hypothetical protein
MFPDTPQDLFSIDRFVDTGFLKNLFGEELQVRLTSLARARTTLLLSREAKTARRKWKSPLLVDGS